MSRRRKESKRVGSYSYTKFDELKIGDNKVKVFLLFICLCLIPTPLHQANVIGLIEVCDPPAPSKADKNVYSCYFELVDESDTKVTCNMSDTNPDYLPPSPCYGDVLCLRKVAVGRIEGQLVLKSATNTAWLLFRKEEDFKATSNFSNLSPNVTEKLRLAQLKTWATKRGNTCSSIAGSL